MGYYVLGELFLDNWKARPALECILEFQGIKRAGRSSVLSLWMDVDGRTFPVFLADLAALIVGHGISAGGVVRGRWEWTKRGSNCALRYAGPITPLSRTAPEVATPAYGEDDIRGRGRRGGY